MSGSGAEGIRTPDLLIANETRYQLRHSPMRRRDGRARGRSYHRAVPSPESGRSGAQAPATVAARRRPLGLEAAAVSASRARAESASSWPEALHAGELDRADRAAGAGLVDVRRQRERQRVPEGAVVGQRLDHACSLGRGQLGEREVDGPRAERERRLAAVRGPRRRWPARGSRRCARARALRRRCCTCGPRAARSPGSQRRRAHRGSPCDHHREVGEPGQGPRPRRGQQQHRQDAATAPGGVRRA